MKKLEVVCSAISITIIEINNWYTQFQSIEILIGINDFSLNWNFIVIEVHIYNWISNGIRNYFYN